MKYEETVADFKKKVSAKFNLPIDKIQLFWHRRELTSEYYDHLTMEKLRMHTGFSIMGYDLTQPPDYFPPCQLTPRGLIQMTPITNEEFLKKHPDAKNDPDVLHIEPGVPIKQKPEWLTTPKEVPFREAPFLL